MSDSEEPKGILPKNFGKIHLPESLKTQAKGILDKVAKNLVIDLIKDRERLTWVLEKNLVYVVDEDVYLDSREEIDAAMAEDPDA